MFYIFCVCDIIDAVGVDANPVCVQHCDAKSAKPAHRAGMHPGSTIEWLQRDCTTLTLGDALVLADMHRLVLFAYLGLSQLNVLRPFLLSIVQAGGRLVTYHNHITVSDSDGVCTTSRFGDILITYTRDSEWDSESAAEWLLAQDAIQLEVVPSPPLLRSVPAMSSSLRLAHWHTSVASARDCRRYVGSVTVPVATPAEALTRTMPSQASPSTASDSGSVCSSPRTPTEY